MPKGMLAIGLMSFGSLVYPFLARAAQPPTDRGAQPSIVIWREAAKGAHRGVQNQITAAEPIAKKYPEASSISMAIAIVPDPLVPRYRRPYDLSIKAIELGMLKDNFVLDRYSFPWSQQLEQDAALSESAASGGASPASGGGAQAGDAAHGAFGLMVFRCDSWRGDACGFPGDAPKTPEQKNTLLRALYIVTDTATQGVATLELRCAIEKIQAQLGQPGGKSPPPAPACPSTDKSAESAPPSTLRTPAASLLAYPEPACAHAGSSNPNLIILGPNFSGAMDSVGAAVAGLGLDNLNLCLISSGTTDTTNVRVRQRYENVYFRSLALPDDAKISHIAEWARQAGFEFDQAPPHAAIRDHRNIAILAEASTFGYGVCSVPGPDKNETPSERRASALTRQFCDLASIVYFPATIADIRFGLQKQQAQQSNDLSAAAKQVQGDEHLSLEDGAENGSEFPESQESALTSASDQLQLDRALDELTTLAPRMVMVVATDVRDRLFLFDQLRGRLPRALLVDLDADNLLAHPDFLHASRGALAVASADLMVHAGKTFGCEHPPAGSPPRAAGAKSDNSLAPWSTDAQGILADTVARLYSPDLHGPVPPPPCVDSDRGPRQAALQVVTLNGFKPVSRAYPAAEATAGEANWWRPTKPPLLTTAEIYAPLFCLILPWIWLRPARPRRRTAAKENRSLRSALLSWPAALCAPLLIIAPVVAYTSTIEVSHSLTYWLAAIEALGCWALWRCDRHLQLSFRESSALPDWNWWLAACLTPAAALLAASPLIWGLGHGSANFSVDEAAVIALGFDANSGIAFFLVPSVAAIAVMCTSAALATSGVIAERNLEVLMGASTHAPASSRRLYVTRAFLPAMVMIALIILLALPGLLDFLGGARLTIFDPYASAMAVFALAATTLCAGVLLCAAVGAARRIRKMCGYVRGRILEGGARAAGACAPQAPGLWSGSVEMPVTFAATPVLARPAGGGASGARLAALDTKTWAAALARLWGQEPAADVDRLALFMLLAGEMTLFRWAAAGTVLGTLASVIIVYLYPVEADPLLLLNLVILAAIGLYSAYVATGFEHDEVLSNVLCNRPKKVQVSVAFFSFIAVPFIALAAAIMIVAIPGVVDWAGGVLAMARALGVHP
jgi:hypothetical protein